MDTVVQHLAGLHPHALFVKVEAEAVPEVRMARVDRVTWTPLSRTGLVSEVRASVFPTVVPMRATGHGLMLTASAACQVSMLFDISVVPTCIFLRGGAWADKHPIVLQPHANPSPPSDQTFSPIIGMRTYIVLGCMRRPRGRG
jgi:hypothetical protein